jgi:hypothetical protein
VEVRDTLGLSTAYRDVDTGIHPKTMQQLHNFIKTNIKTNTQAHKDTLDPGTYTFWDT